MYDNPHSPKTTQELDLQNPAVRSEMVRSFAARFSHLCQEVLKGDPQPGSHLPDVFAAIILSTERFDPTEDPTFESWLYRLAVKYLAALSAKKHQKTLRARLVRVLQEPPHNLTTPEIASALGVRESEVEKRKHPVLDILSSRSHPQSDVQLADLERTVAERVAAAPAHLQQSLSNTRRAPGREALWLIAGLGGVLLLVLAFIRSGESQQGVSLFPTPTPPPPELIGIEHPNIQTAPAVEEELSTAGYNNIQPLLSADGRFVLFISDHPLLVPNDTNDAYDVFRYEISTGEMRRVSVSDTGEQLSGDSFAAAISADGARIVYTRAGADGELEVILSDVAKRESRQINFFSDGSTIREAYAAGLSGDGSVAVFWGTAEDFDDNTCPADLPGPLCYNLYVYDDREGTVHPLPDIGVPADLWFSTNLTISTDGSTVALTINQDSPLWQNLGSQNASEAIIYNWRTGEYLALNRTPDGRPGNGESYKPVLSANGRVAVFYSTATDLVPDDTNETMDLFYYEIGSGRVSRINLTPDGEQAENDFRWDDFTYYNTPAISPDGVHVVFFSAATNLLADMNSSFCTSNDTSGRICYGIFDYDHAANRTQQVSTNPLYRAGNLSKIGLLYSVSNGGDVISLMMASWEGGLPCEAEGCTTIWLLFPKEGDARLVSAIDRSYLADPEHQPWKYAGNFTGPDRWVKGLAVSPDGVWAATGDNQGSVLVSELDTGRQLFSFSSPTGEINALTISPDGERLAAATRDGTALVWNTRSGGLEFSLYDHPGVALETAFSPDGQYLAVGAQQALWIWRLENGEFVLAQSYGQTRVNAVAFSPDSKWIAYSSGDEVWVRRVLDGEVIARLGGHSERVLDVKFSPDQSGGYLLATSSQDGRVILWQMSLDEQPEIVYVRTLAHADWVSALAFSPDGRLLAAGTFGSRIVLWDLPGGTFRQTLQRTRQDQILSLSFTPDGNTLLAGSVQGVRVWSNEDGLDTPPPESQFFAFAQGSMYIEDLPYTSNWFRNEDVEAEIVHDPEEALDSRIYPPWPDRAALPDNFTLSAIAIYRDRNDKVLGSAWVYQVTTNFQPARLTIFQTTRPLKDADWPISAETEILLIEVLDYDAELVLGGWGEVASSQVTSSGNLAQTRPWNSEAASIWLRWKDGQTSFSIFYDQPFSASFVPESDLVTPQDLIQIAESLYR